MEEDKNQTITDKVWSFFSSIKLAVVLFALIGLTSIIGTIIEQNVPPEKNLKLIGKLFGSSIAPTLYSIFDKLGFMDMYTSWWFIALLLLFASNTIICSIDRLPRILNLIKEPIKPLTDEQFKGIGTRKEIVLKERPERIKERISTAIKKAGLPFLEVKEPQGYQLYSEKGKYTRLGVYITHLSILLILFGAIIGIFFGFKGFLNLQEGQTADVVYLRNEPVWEKIMASLGIRESVVLHNPMSSMLALPLTFSIRCDNFFVDFYGRSNMPKEFRSWLTVLQDGRPVIEKTIEVNDPLSYGGITFYQSSYGFLPEATGKFILKITSKTGTSETKYINLDDKFIIPNTNIEGSIKDFSPALSFDISGKAITFSEQMNNPAVFVEFSENGRQKYSGWIIKRYPETWDLPDGHKVEFVDYWGVEYTGLQVRSDPGVWVVYLGCIVMSIGLYIVFFMNHRKIWVRLVEEKNNTRVIFAFNASKNRQAFEKKIEKIISLLSKSGIGGKQ